MESNKKAWFLISVIILSVFHINIIYAVGYSTYPAQDLEHYSISADGGETEIIVHNEGCRKITNNADKEVFVPTKTYVEWSYFINNDNAPEIIIRNTSSCRKLCEGQGNGEIKAIVNLGFTGDYTVYCNNFEDPDNILDLGMKDYPWNGTNGWKPIEWSSSDSYNSALEDSWPGTRYEGNAHCAQGDIGNNWRCEGARFDKSPPFISHGCSCSWGDCEGKCLCPLLSPLKYRGQEYSTWSQCACRTDPQANYGCPLGQDPWTCAEVFVSSCIDEGSGVCDVCSPPNCTKYVSCDPNCGCSVGL